MAVVLFDLMSINHKTVLLIECLVVLLLASFPHIAAAQSLTNLAGTWNNVMLSSPSRLTMEKFSLPPPMEGSVLVSIPEKDLFDASTGTVVLQTNGNFTGSASGTVSLADGGQVVVIPATSNAPVTFSMNAAGDFMYTMKYSDPKIQDIELLLKAPTTISNAEVAGTWNVVSFAMPAQIILEKDSYSGVSYVTNAYIWSGFRTSSKILTAYANGTLQLNDGGNLISGSFSFTNAGTVHMVFNAPAPMGTFTLDFFINVSKNMMAGLYPYDPDSKEIILAVKQPTNAAPVDFKGLWRWGNFVTPTNITQIRVGVPNTTNYSVVTDIVEKDDFEIVSQAVCVGHNGYFTADPSIGSASIAGPGRLQITVTNNETWGTNAVIDEAALLCNAAKDVMVGIKPEGRNRLIISTRAPAATVRRTAMGLVAYALTNIYWASDTNRSLQYSTNVTSGWTTLTNTLGQSSYTFTPGVGSNRFFRVTEP